MEYRRQSLDALTGRQNGAQERERKVTYAGHSSANRIRAYEYNIVPRSIVNLKEEDVEAEDQQKVRRQKGIPFEEDFALKNSKRLNQFSRVNVCLGSHYKEGFVDAFKDDCVLSRELLFPRPGKS
ncbi:hypothetical protein E2C01_005712 [Portunus trituberculatus]|uniref:Uncharacterized protein n=1 Tax=Portunus trituberculatus TaxID=210409 RepID=A0A5B7CW74_PORTR|nr:hypothetical protein [Portunus trituberculatus]